MKPAFGNLYFILNNPINQAVFFINSSGQKTGIIKLQWLGFANTFKRMTCKFPDCVWKFDNFIVYYIQHVHRNRPGWNTDQSCYRQ